MSKHSLVDFGIALVPYGLSYAASLFPVWCGTLVVLFRRPRLPRRLAFVIVESALSYGLLILYFLLFVLPPAFYANVVEPQLEMFGYHVSIFDSVMRRLGNPSGLVAGVGIAILPPLVTWYLVPRWARLAEAAARVRGHDAQASPPDVRTPAP